MATLFALLVAVPAVVLSAEHEKTCAVAVGDALPDLATFDAAGKPTPLAPLRGERATVVAVTGPSGAGQPWMADALLADLGHEFVGRAGVRTVAVSLGAVAKVADGITALRADAAKTRAALGEGRYPRVYVLEPAGKVVWFDIEYSESTRRELRATLDELAADPDSNKK